MNRNRSASHFLRLPAEIRLQIYNLVLGGQQVWISHDGSALRRGAPGTTHLGPSNQYFHRWGKFSHRTAGALSKFNPIVSILRIGLLRVCRQIYIETGLLPYTLNAFTFENDYVREKFEQIVRPRRKMVQKEAVGKYELGSWSQFRSRHCPGKKWRRVYS